MPTIQHKDIADADRHEPKGASSATGTKQALFGNGDGTTQFRDIVWADVVGTPTFSAVMTLEFSAYSTADQTVAAANTPLQIAFGAGATGDNTTLDSLGSLTFDSDGTYYIQLEFSAAKTSGASATRLFFRETYDGADLDRACCVRFRSSENDSQEIVHFTSIIEATAGKIYKVYLAADTNNTVGLISDPIPAPIGWGNTDTHSAHMRVYRFTT